MGYFSNNMYGMDPFSTFRPIEATPPSTNLIEMPTQHEYANHQPQYFMATEAPPPPPPETPAEDYSREYGEDMKTSILWGKNLNDFSYYEKKYIDFHLSVLLF